MKSPEVSCIRATLLGVPGIPILSPLARRRVSIVCATLAVAAVVAAVASHALASLAAPSSGSGCAQRAAILAAAGDGHSRDAVVVQSGRHRLAAICRTDRHLIFLRASSEGWRVLHARPYGADALVAACAAS